ncbi:MAG: YqgE/AlgH family protein [Pseudomonadota bacterium]|mgnify:FL=1|uniref:YqgE/AlgH family protein n=1 Tax=Phenylobacterium sp. TaxID=1871053 RepID=UPI0025F0BBB5|nr:YqgE/AlgH family protein [Phenylobacterium sp.]
MKVKFQNMDDGVFLSGQMLIAMPGIGDPRFERALVLICAHDESHAMGIAVNRPVEGLTVPDLLGRLEVRSTIQIPPDLVLLGGPVDRERGFVLHTDDYTSGENSLPIREGISLTATREVLEAMAGQSRPPRRSLLALGYAGWGPGQLEREIRENVWLTCDADETLVFGGDHEQKWTKALAKIGVDARLLTTTAGRA